MRETKTEYRMHFLPEPVCWTEAPTTLRALGRQRSRWQRGALETFFKHKRMALNPRYGVVGLLGFGNSLLVDVLGPPLEVLGLIMLPIFLVLGVAKRHICRGVLFPFVRIRGFHQRRFPFSGGARTAALPAGTRPDHPNARGGGRKFWLPADEQPMAHPRVLAVPYRRQELGPYDARRFLQNVEELVYGVVFNRFVARSKQHGAWCMPQVLLLVFWG